MAPTIFPGNLYVVGGSDGHQCLASVELYNSGSQCWTSTAPLATPRCNVGVACSRSSLYAVGGFSGLDFLADSEFVDSTQNSGEWCTSVRLDQPDSSDSGHSDTGDSPGVVEGRPTLYDGDTITNAYSTST